MDFGKIVEQFGVHYDKSRAISKAMVYCKKCIIMAGSWTTYNHMHEGQDYMWLERSHTEEFIKKWTLFTTETTTRMKSTSSSGDDQVAIAEGSAVKRGKGAEAKPDHTKVENPKGSKKRASSGTNDEGKPGKLTTDAKLKVLIKEGTKLKHSYHQLHSAASHLVIRIESEDTWSWARGQMLTSLKKSLDDLAKGLGHFGNDFVVSELSTTKKKYEDHILIANLGEFVELSPLLKHVETMVNKLTDMHQRSIA